MKRPIILWFASEKTKYQTIIRKLKQKGINSILCSHWDEFVTLLYEKDIAISVVEHTHVTDQRLNSNTVYKILSIAKVHSQVVVGREMDLEIGKENSIDTLLPNRITNEDFIAELTAYWEAFKILTGSHGQFENLNSHDSVDAMLKSDLTIKDRKISTLYTQLVETQNKTRVLYSEWKKMNIPLKTKRLYEFDFKFRNALKEYNADWEEFHDHFVMIHPNFFKELSEKHNTLSEENQKMCAYIKMGLSNKQIANYLSILPNSVKRTQTRIKNRIGLSKEMTLRKYIQGDIG